MSAIVVVALSFHGSSECKAALKYCTYFNLDGDGRGMDGSSVSQYRPGTTTDHVLVLVRQLQFPYLARLAMPSVVQ
jgi:hypothetical protein